MTKAKTAPKNAGTDKESIAAARRAALNETLKASGLTPHALARMAGIDGGNLRAAASGVKGMGEAKWLKVAAASPAGSALRDLFPDTAIAAVGMPAGTPHSGIISVPFNKLVPNPDNYRKTFDKVELENLAESILDHGILQNLVVLPVIDGIHHVLPGVFEDAPGRAEVTIDGLNQGRSKSAQALADGLQYAPGDLPRVGHVAQALDGVHRPLLNAAIGRELAHFFAQPARAVHQIQDSFSAQV